jgi:hypothetical protein
MSAPLVFPFPCFYSLIAFYHLLYFYTAGVISQIAKARFRASPDLYPMNRQWLFKFTYASAYSNLKNVIFTTTFSLLSNASNILRIISDFLKQTENKIYMKEINFSFTIFSSIKPEYGACITTGFPFQSQSNLNFAFSHSLCIN